MDAGKAASQAGHAYLGAYLESAASYGLFRDQASEYACQKPGTKVCLSATLREIQDIKYRADAANLPNFLVVDSGCSNFYDGLPTVTALGIGPATRDQVKPLIKKLKLLK